MLLKYFATSSVQLNARANATHLQAVITLRPADRNTTPANVKHIHTHTLLIVILTRTRSLVYSL